MAQASEGVELTVLLLTINEVSAMKAILPRIKEALGPCLRGWEVLVLDGGSTDGTAEAALEAGARVSLQKERGYGNAYRQGLAEAGGRWILSLDADGSHPVEVIPRLWALRGEYDAVTGSRYLPESRDPRPLLRRVMSLVLNRCFALFLGVPLTDFSGALRLYRAEAVRAVPSDAENFDVLAQVLVGLHLRGGRIREVPYHYQPRLGGRSKARLVSFSLAYALTLARCWWRVATSGMSPEDGASWS